MSGDKGTGKGDSVPVIGSRFVTDPQASRERFVGPLSVLAQALLRAQAPLGTRAELYQLFATHVRQNNHQLPRQYEEYLRALQVLAESDAEDVFNEDDIDAGRIPNRMAETMRRIQEGDITEHIDVVVIDIVEIETYLIDTMVLIETGRLV